MRILSHPGNVGLLVFGVVVLLAGSLGGASVGPAGYANDFSKQPSGADWATFNRTGAPSDVYDIDADVNASITAAGVTAQTSLVAADPPPTDTVADWSSTGLYLQTRPKLNRYVALMGKFVNNTGTNATQAAFSYLYTIAAGGVAEDPGKGTRVYYSLTGLANSWTNLPTLNHFATDNISSILSTNLAVNWINGASLYLLWVDDNSNNVGSDAANQIDDFSLYATVGIPANLPPSITLTTPGQALRVAPGANFTLKAAASDPDGSIVRVEFFDGVSLLGQRTNLPFGLAWDNPPPGIHVVSARATDDAGLQATSQLVVIEVISANADLVLFPDFNDPSSLLLQGSAAALTNRLRLTPALPNQVGGAWLNGKEFVQTGFESVFQFQISQGSSSGADGLAFVIFNSGYPALGDLGAGMGYSSVTNNLAVEFDTFQNPEAADPDGNHIGVHSRGAGRNTSDESAALGRAAPSINMSDGAVHTVVIRYTAGVLLIFLDNLKGPVLTVPVDLGTLLSLDGGAAWVGLTSGTGGEYENHDILMWSFRALPVFGVLQLGQAVVEGDGSVAVEFATTSGQTYTVQYCSDLLHWTDAVPSMSGTGALAQWHDTGPPATGSLPGTQPSRFYRVVLSP